MSVLTSEMRATWIIQGGQLQSRNFYIPGVLYMETGQR